MRKINELICDLYFEILLFNGRRQNLETSRKWAKNA